MAKQGNSKNPRRSGIQPRMPKKPAGGMQSWMIIGLVIAMVSMFFFTKQNTLQEIDQRQFESMVIQKEVQSVVIVNDKLVEVSLKPSFVSKYFKKSPQGLVSVKQGPHFEFPIISKEGFEHFLEDRQ